MPKLLMLTERFPPDIGGVARSAGRTAARLSQLGAPTDVFTWTKTLPPGQLETTAFSVDEQHEVVVHRLGLFANFDLSMQHTMNVVEWLQAQENYEALWGHYLYPSGFMAVLLAAMLELPSIVSARGNDIDRLMFPPGDFARLKWTLERATAVTSVSHDLAKKIRCLTPDASPQVIHNTVDADVFADSSIDVDSRAQLRRQLGIYPNELVLGFCGELRHKKGLPFLVSALQQVREQRPACLLVIGTIRTREQATIQEYLSEDDSTRKRILVSGQLDTLSEVAAHLHLCDVIMCPSVWDGLPNAVLEAMACGKVVIASDAGGIPEIIDHGKDGFLVPKSQLHRLGEAVLEVAALAPEQISEFTNAARAKIAERFHPERELSELRVLLDRIV